MLKQMNLIFLPYYFQYYVDRPGLLVLALFFLVLTIVGLVTMLKGEFRDDM
jgi:hypothetical protein